MGDDSIAERAIITGALGAELQELLGRCRESRIGEISRELRGKPRSLHTCQKTMMTKKSIQYQNSRASVADWRSPVTRHQVGGANNCMPDTSDSYCNSLLVQRCKGISTYIQQCRLHNSSKSSIVCGICQHQTSLLFY